MALYRVYRFINNASLDVAAGAVVCMYFFSSIAHVVLRWQAGVALGISVWIIYTADHLLDARMIKGPASTARHRFHQENFTTLLIALFVALTVDTVLIFYLRLPVFFSGLILGILVVVYFIINQNLHFMKELVGALFYTSGIVLPVVALSDFELGVSTWLLIIQFMITALINLLLFALFDRQNDEKDSHSSFVTTMGEHTTRTILVLLFFACTFIFVCQLYFHCWPALIITIMDLVLLFIFLFRRYFMLKDRYRFWGDAVFLLPLLYLSY